MEYTGIYKPQSHSTFCLEYRIGPKFDEKSLQILPNYQTLFAKDLTIQLLLAISIITFSPNFILPNCIFYIFAQLFSHHTFVLYGTS